MAEDDRRIVVGVDGTETAAAALRWAVRQSGYTGARLEAVLAWESPATYEWAPDLTDPADVEAAAREVLDKALADVAAPVTRSVVRGNAVRVLLDAAQMCIRDSCTTRPARCWWCGAEPRWVTTARPGRRSPTSPGGPRGGSGSGHRGLRPWVSARGHRARRGSGRRSTSARSRRARTSG